MRPCDSDRGQLLLLASQWLPTRAPAEQVANGLIGLAERVEQRGHAVRVIGPAAGSDVGSWPIEVLNVVERLRPENVLRCAVCSYAAGYFLRWPRDAFQDCGTFIAVNDDPVVSCLSQQLSLRATKVSALCEGGLAIRLDQIWMLSSSLSGVADAELAAVDAETYFMPAPGASILYRREYGIFYGDLSHLDRDLSLLRDSAGQLMLLVGSTYRAAYRPNVDAFAHRVGAAIFVVPAKEVERKAINLIYLSPSAVIVPAECPETTAFLRERMGSEAVLVQCIGDDFTYNGGRGGLRCMSAVLNLARLHM